MTKKKLEALIKFGEAHSKVVQAYKESEGEITPKTLRLEVEEAILLGKVKQIGEDERK